MGHPADSLGTLGIIGGGQIARMTALSARALGYRVHALDPNARCPIAPLVDRLVVAAYDDIPAGLSLAQDCDVVTIDQEHVPLPTLTAIASRAPLRPGPAALQIIQDRQRQKEWLRDRGFPVAPFRAATGARQLREALLAFKGAVFVKASQRDVDGRGRCLAHAGSRAHEVLAQLRCSRVTVEHMLALKCELSVLVARRPGGETTAYPAALNHHEHGVLSFSLLPAPLRASLVARAKQLATAIATDLDVVGLCVVEMFVLHDDSLLVNEIAARPHNTYHGSDRAFETSQFEQLVRAVFDLPLGPIATIRHTAMANLLGDLWLSPSPPAFQRALAVPGVRVQLYGKHEVRRGRRLGHLTATGGCAMEALERVLAARRALASEPPAETLSAG